MIKFVHEGALKVFGVENIDEAQARSDASNLQVETCLWNLRGVRRILDGDAKVFVASAEKIQDIVPASVAN